MAERIHTDLDQQCEICGKRVMTKSELEDHIVEDRPDAATPEILDSYNQRGHGTGADRAA